MSETSAVITGASGTIGGAVARRWATRFPRLVLVGRDADRLDHTVEGVRAAGGRAIGVVADLVDPRARTRCVPRSVRPGSTPWSAQQVEADARSGPTADLTASDWSTALAGNLTTTTTALAAVLPGMLARGRGSIVLIGSDAGHTGTDASLPYATAKAAVAALGQHLAARVARDGVRVNVVAPGTVRTPRIARLDDGVLRALANTHLRGRIGAPDDLAALVEFLASKEAGWITGEVLAPGGRALG